MRALSIGNRNAEAHHAPIIWHALEHNDVIEWSRVGQLGNASAPRRRRTVTFYPATELDVAVNGHHVEA